MRRYRVSTVVALGVGLLCGRMLEAQDVVFDTTNPRIVVTNCFCVGIAVGDLDGDGDADVAAIHNWRGDFVSWNDGEGNFSDEYLGNAGYREHGIVLADYDHDYDLDILTEAYWYVNNGDRTFTAVSGLPGHRYMRAGDLNGDEWPDVVAGRNVYINDQTGGFSLTQTFPQEGWSVGVALGDVDGDQDLDIALGQHLWLNDGSGTFIDSGQDLHPEGVTNSGGRQFADINNDGHVDLLVARSVVGSFALLNDGTGAFAWTGQLLATTTEIEAGDLNGDGNIDVVTSNPCNVYLGDGTGWFDGPVQTIQEAGSPHPDVALGDFNGDSGLDVLVGSVDLNNCGDPTVFINIVQPPIPTISQWGLIVMTLLLLTAGTFVYARRRPDHA